MSADAAKQRLQAAERHLQKGSRKRAIAELRKVLKKEPENIRALTRLGDIYAEGGDMTAARAAYVKVGDFYRREGYLLKAISMYKALTERFPDDPNLLVALGDLFRQMGLFSDAVIRYRTAIDVFNARNDVAEKLAVVQKVLDLSPDNVVDRVRLAEAYVSLKSVDEGIEQFRLGASELYRRGEHQAFIQVAERLLFFRADDVEANRRLAEVYTKRKEYLKALEKLQVSHELAPGDRGILEMIARTFVELGENDKAAFVVKELVRLAEQDNLLPEKERYERQLLRLGVRPVGEIEDAGRLREGQEVEFEDFGDVTVLEDINQRDFPEIPIDNGELNAAEGAFEEADLLDDDDDYGAAGEAGDDFASEEPSDEVEFDVGEFEETVVANTDFGDFETEEDAFEAIRRMRAAVPGGQTAGEPPAGEAKGAPGGAGDTARLAVDDAGGAVEDVDDSDLGDEPADDLDEFVDGEPSAEVAAQVFPEPLELPESVDEDLQEVDFYLQNGLIDEAAEVLGELLTQYPGSPRLLEKQRAVEDAR